MFQWLSENIGTIIVCALLIAFFVVMAMRHFKKRRDGASGCACGSGCTCCPNCGNCDSHTH